MRLAIPWAIVAALGTSSLLAACPGPKMPSGPPPEYEEPPPPSWLSDAAAPAPTAPPAPIEGDGGLPSS